MGVSSEWLRGRLLFSRETSQPQTRVSLLSAMNLFVLICACTCALMLALVSPAAAAFPFALLAPFAGEAAKGASGAQAETVRGVLNAGKGVLDNISKSYYENPAYVCYWNDWRSRDSRARIFKTYRNGRFSRQKRTWGFVNGRWYCTYKQDALKVLGWS